MIRRQHEAIARADEYAQLAAKTGNYEKARAYAEIALVYAELAKALRPG